MYHIKEKCVIHFKLSVDFRGCDYSKEMTVQPMISWLGSESKYAHLTNNAKCNFVFKYEERSMPLHEMKKYSFLSKLQCNPFYMKS